MYNHPFLLALLLSLVFKFLIKMAETSEVSTDSRVLQYCRRLVKTIIDMTGIDTLRICHKLLEHSLALLLLESTISAAQVPAPEVEICNEQVVAL